MYFDSPRRETTSDGEEKDEILLGDTFGWTCMLNSTAT
jgi:hypothetical protein